MKISDIYTAKGLKFKLTYLDASARFSVGALVSIESTQNDKEFLVKQYGAAIRVSGNPLFARRIKQHLIIWLICLKLKRLILSGVSFR